MGPKVVETGEMWLRENLEFWKDSLNPQIYFHQCGDCRVKLQIALVIRYIYDSMSWTTVYLLPFTLL